VSGVSLGNLPAFQCYDCRGCGECCRGYLAINLTPEERDRLQAQGWGSDPCLQGQPLFTQRGGTYYLAHRADGCCVFLDGENRCRIHAKFGEAAKPLTCRLYPFGFVPAGKDVRIDLRFDCPAAAENDGRPLSTHRGALTELLAQAAPAEMREAPAPPLLDGVELDWPRLQRVTRAFEELLRLDRLNLTQRLACCVNLAAALDNPRLRGVEEKQLDELLAKASAKVIEMGEDELPREPPAVPVQAMFRQLLTVYGRRDRANAKESVWERLKMSLSMARGRGTVPPLRPDFPAVSFADLEITFDVPDGEAAQALVRYYRMRLWSMSFCGRAFYGRSYLDGLSALWLTYPIILWFARLFAAGEGKAALERAHVERALAIVDHQHGRTPLLNVRAERFRQANLCERGTLRSLVIWYGT
jgi:lysine-N-methylase